MWVSVNGEPQPYAVLERAAEEEAQMFTIDADDAGAAARRPPGPRRLLVSAGEHVLATDAVHLITATIVSWPGVAKRRWKVLAAAAARPYLGRSNPKLARGPAPA